jgi:putative transposase
MSRRVSPSTDKVYGVERVTRLWGVARATVHRHRHGSDGTAHERPGPLGAMSDDGSVQEIRKLPTASPFHGEGHRVPPAVVGTPAWSLRGQGRG